MNKDKVIQEGEVDKLCVCINKENHNIEIFTEYKRNDTWFTDQTIMLSYEQIDKIVKLIKK